MEQHKLAPTIKLGNTFELDADIDFFMNITEPEEKKKEVYIPTKQKPKAPNALF